MTDATNKYELLSKADVIRQPLSLEALLSALTAPGISTQEAPPILTLMREEETWHLALPADRASFRMAECGQWREASSVDLYEAAAELAEARRQDQENAR